MRIKRKLGVFNQLVSAGDPLFRLTHRQPFSDQRGHRRLNNGRATLRTSNSTIDAGSFCLHLHIPLLRSPRRRGRLKSTFVVPLGTASRKTVIQWHGQWHGFQSSPGFLEETTLRCVARASAIPPASISVQQDRIPAGTLSWHRT